MLNMDFALVAALVLFGILHRARQVRHFNSFLRLPNPSSLLLSAGLFFHPSLPSAAGLNNLAGSVLLSSWFLHLFFVYQILFLLCLLPLFYLWYMR